MCKRLPIDIRSSPHPRHNQRAYMNSMKTEQFGREFLYRHQEHLCVCTNDSVFVPLLSLTGRISAGRLSKCRYHASHDTYGIRHGSTCFDSGSKNRSQGREEEEDWARDNACTYTTGVRMHSNTASPCTQCFCSTAHN